MGLCSHQRRAVYIPDARRAGNVPQLLQRNGWNVRHILQAVGAC